MVSLLLPEKAQRPEEEGGVVNLLRRLSPGTETAYFGCVLGARGK